MGKSEDKKSFQLYNDYIDHFSLMSDEEAGKLIKAIFCYVNDLPCEELAGLPLMAFSFIRSQLKLHGNRPVRGRGWYSFRVHRGLNVYGYEENLR